MTDSPTSSDATPWLLLIHQVPPKPDYLRVKIGRRLLRVGAVAIKNSVYALPDRAQSMEDFQWIRAEIVDGGGDASICRAAFVDGLTNDDVEFLFNGARDAEYAELTRDARALWSDVRRDRSSRAEDELARLRKRFVAISAIDFFGAPGRAMTEQALRTLSDGLEPTSSRGAESRVAGEKNRAVYRGRTWVTRPGIFVDRIASAWLIRRFIDRDARFKFSDEAKAVVRGEVRFDMMPGEFTHEGDRCTFETLLERFALEDAALRAIAEIVHDIDLKDDKFGRDDAAGIERVLAGIAASHADDDARLDRGSQLFDDLYALFTAQPQTAVRG